jgi:hypothetical protein
MSDGPPACAPLDVLWAFDREAIDRRTGQSGKWKLLVVMASGPGAENLILFRINTAAVTQCGPRPGSILIARDPHHPFLDHDSYLFCGGPPVVLTDAQLQVAMEGQAIPSRQGIVGRIHPSLIPGIRAAVEASAELSDTLRALILASLDPDRR